MEVEGGRFVGCSVGIEDKPAGGRAHGLAERLLADGFAMVRPQRLFVRDRRAGVNCPCCKSEIFGSTHASGVRTVAKPRVVDCFFSPRHHYVARQHLVMRRSFPT